MKKIIRVLLVVMLVMSMVTPAFATEGFVGSISEKPGNIIHMGTTNENEPYYGIIKDEDGNITHYLVEGQIIVTPYAKIDESKVLPQSTKDLMHKVYGELKDGIVKLSDVPGLADAVKDKLGDDVNVDESIVVYDLYDVTVINPEALGLGAGSSLTITFNLSIDTDRFLQVMAYNGSGWNLVPFTNNGQTITVTLAGPGPVAFLTDVAADGPVDDEGTVGDDEGTTDEGTTDEGTTDEGTTDEGTTDEGTTDEGKTEGEGSDTPETGDDSNPLLWGGILVVAAAGIILLFKKNREEQ